MTVRELTGLSSNTIRKAYPAFEMMVDLLEEPFFRYGETRRIRVSVKNCFEMRRQEWVRLRVHVPAGAEIQGASEYMLPLNNLWGAEAQAEFCIDVDQYTGGKLEFLVEAQLEGRHSYGVIKVVLMRKK